MMETGQVDKVTLLPVEIIEVLKNHCNNNKLGLAIVTSQEGVVAIMIGNGSIDANYAAIISAHGMLAGILNGEWDSPVNRVLVSAEPEGKM